MKERQVEFKDKQGRRIVGDYLVPEWTKPLPVVIVCHGFKGNRNETHIKAISEEIVAAGIATLRFDFTHDPGGSSLPFADMTVSYELEVLDEAVKFVGSQKEVDSENIGIAGHSLGGLVVGWYAANHPEISAVAPLSGVYSFEEMWTKTYGEASVKEFREKGFAYVFSQTLNKPLRIKESFYEDAINYEMDKVIDNLVCPILVVHGASDQFVPIEHAQHFYDRSQSREKGLEIIKGSDHNYTKPGNLAQVKKAVAEWFAKVLLEKDN